MVIESQVEAKGLGVDEAMDLVLDPLCLHRANPCYPSGKKLRRHFVQGGRCSEPEGLDENPPVRGH